MFAIPPTLICVMAIAALVHQHTGVPIAETLRDVIERNAPSETKQLLDALVQHGIVSADDGAVSLRVLVSGTLAFWDAGGGVGTLLDACNRAYDVRDARSFVRGKLVTLALTTVLVLVSLFMLFIFGTDAGTWLTARLGHDDAARGVWRWARWPLLSALTVLIICAIYVVGTSIAQSLRWVLPGSVLATTSVFGTLAGFRE